MDRRFRFGQRLDRLNFDSVLVLGEMEKFIIVNVKKKQLRMAGCAYANIQRILRLQIDLASWAEIVCFGKNSACHGKCSLSHQYIGKCSGLGHFRLVLGLFEVELHSQLTWQLGETSLFGRLITPKSSLFHLYGDTDIGFVVEVPKLC